MRNVFMFWSGLLVLVLLIGCSTVRSTTSQAQAAILSGSWIMEKWIGYDTVSVAFPHGLPVLVVDTEAQTVSGSNGCNSIMGKMRYDRKVATIQFYEISSTKMFCQTVPENEFHQALASVNNYRVTQDRLTLLKGSDEIMVLRRE